MGILRRLREWREDKDGTLIGPDIEADSVDAGSVNTDRLKNASDADRPVFDGEGAITVNVPNDFATIQEAADMARVLNFDRYQINVDDGDYSNEDIVIGPALAHDIDKDGVDTTRSIRIVGNQSSPSNVKIGSLVVQGVVGLADVIGVEFDHENPYDDERSAISAYHTNELLLDDIAFNPSGTWDNTSDGSRGLIAYGSNVNLKAADFGSGLLAGGVIAKREGVVDVAGPLTGNPTDRAFDCRSATILFNGPNATSMESANNLTEGNGHIVDYGNDIQYLPTAYDHDISDGASQVVRWYDKSNSKFGEVVQETRGVSTTATSILNNDQLDLSGRGGLAIVYGVDSTDDTVGFTDLVMYVAFGGASTIGSESRGTPAGRTYSVSGHDLQLAMASDTYNIKTVWMGGTNN